MKRRDDERVAQLMNTVSWLSYDDNNDGEGYLKMSREGVDLGRKLEKHIFRDKAHTLVTHQRWSTSGSVIVDYVHPFETRDLVVFHNGVLDCAEGSHSDTYIYAKMLQEEFVATKGDIKATIENVHKKVEGMYSVVIYLKKAKQLLYFKNSTSNFYFAKFNNYLVASTKKENVDYACKYLKYSKKRIYTPKEFRLYDVLAGMRELTTLSLPSDYSSAGRVYGWGDGEDYDCTGYEMGSYKNHQGTSKLMTMADGTHKSMRYSSDKGCDYAEWDAGMQCWVDQNHIPIAYHEQTKMSDRYWEEREKQEQDRMALSTLFDGTKKKDTI